MADDKDTIFLVGSEEFRYLQFSADQNIRYLNVNYYHLIYIVAKYKRIVLHYIVVLFHVLGRPQLLAFNCNTMILLT